MDCLDLVEANSLCLILLTVYMLPYNDVIMWILQLLVKLCSSLGTNVTTRNCLTTCLSDSSGDLWSCRSNKGTVSWLDFYFHIQFTPPDHLRNITRMQFNPARRQTAPWLSHFNHWRQLHINLAWLCIFRRHKLFKSCLTADQIEHRESMSSLSWMTPHIIFPFSWKLEMA